VSIRLLLLAATCCVWAGARAHDGMHTTRGASVPIDPPAQAAASPRERAAQIFFSDKRLVTQHGRDVAFYTDVLRNNVVLINFFFTQCTDSCPTQSARLEEVQALLQANPRPRVKLVSISVDPANDSPSTLTAYAARWHASADWTFLTGKPENVGDVLRRLGQLVAERSAHTSLFIAGNAATGHWLKLDPDTAPFAIAAELRALADEASTRTTALEPPP
jgi:protein SCO1/2